MYLRLNVFQRSMKVYELSIVDEKIYVKDQVEEEFRFGTLQEMVQNRGSEVIGLKGFSSVQSAVKAIGDHLRDWERGTHMGDVSKSVYVEDLFGVSIRSFCSVPVQVVEKKIVVKNDIVMDERSKELIMKSLEELVQEMQMLEQL